MHILRHGTDPEAWPSANSDANDGSAVSTCERGNWRANMGRALTTCRQISGRSLPGIFYLIKKSGKPRRHDFLSFCSWRQLEDRHKDLSFHKPALNFPYLVQPAFQPFLFMKRVHHLFVVYPNAARNAMLSMPRENHANTRDKNNSGVAIGANQRGPCTTHR